MRLSLQRVSLRFGSLPLTSPPIGQALALDAAQRRVGTGRVIHAEGGAVIVSEVELGEVAMEVFLAAMMVDATHPALENAEEALERVGVGLAAPTRRRGGSLIHG
jgi:hypothetical protein